nr:hypothetical protein [uncultured bacterium]
MASGFSLNPVLPIYLPNSERSKIKVSDTIASLPDRYGLPPKGGADVKSSAPKMNLTFGSNHSGVLAFPVKFPLIDGPFIASVRYSVTGGWHLSIQRLVRMLVIVFVSPRRKPFPAVSDATPDHFSGNDICFERAMKTLLLSLRLWMVRPPVDHSDASRHQPHFKRGITCCIVVLPTTRTSPRAAIIA